MVLVEDIFLILFFMWFFFFLLVYLFIILLVIYIYEYHGQSTQAILNKENDNYHRTLALVP